MGSHLLRSWSLRSTRSGSVVDGLHVENDRDRKPQPARSMSRSNEGRPLEASHLRLQEGGTETAHSGQGETLLLANSSSSRVGRPVFSVTANKASRGTLRRRKHGGL